MMAVVSPRAVSPEPVSPELQCAVERFLYAEARLLEENRFDEWLECFAADVRYWMPVREHIEGAGDVAGTANGFALYDDDKQSLVLRATRLKTGMAPSEVPPSVTQRLVTNVMVSGAAAAGEFEVRSSFVVYQERRGRHKVTFFGRREDLLRRADGRFQIGRRKIELAQTVLPTTLSIFF
jgi:3-phenylpropionate/cinnamic acid dioxygenase small subunit